MWAELQTVDLSVLSMQNVLATWHVRRKVVGILAQDLVGLEQSVEWSTMGQYVRVCLDSQVTHSQAALLFQQVRFHA